MSKGGIVGLLIFGLLWTGLVGAFDIMMGRGLVRQAATTRFAETTGLVTHSEVTRHRGSKGGSTYGVDLRYTYRVDGREYHGTRYRHGAFTSTSDSGWANAAVARNPVGAEVRVFYAPADPGNAVLDTGLRGSDLFAVLFLMPFNMVMLGLWSVPAALLRQRWQRPEVGGEWWMDDGRRLRVRLPRWSAWLAGLATVGLGSFVSIFVLGFSTGFNPGFTTVLLVLFGLLGAGVAAAGWTWKKQSDGSADLVVDAFEQTVELPATYGRETRRTVPLTAVQGVSVETIARRGSKGGTTNSYAVNLSAQGHSEKLIEWHDRARAEALADWLRSRLPAADSVAPPRKTRAGEGSPR